MSRTTPSLQFPGHAADSAATSAEEGTAEPMDLSDGREWPRVWLSLVLSLVIYVPMALALAQVIPGPRTPLGKAAAAKAAADFVPFDQMEIYICPEPLEKARYLLALLCVAILPTVFYLVSLRFIRPDVLDVLNRPGPLAVRDLLLVIALVAWFSVLCGTSWIPNSGKHLLAALSLALVIVFRWRDIPRMTPIMSRFVIGSLAVLGFLTQCVGENWFFRCQFIWHHMDILLAAVNQVAHGKTVLVDTTSQYGIFYPYVIAAALWPFGVSQPGMTVVFATLVLLQSALLFLAFKRLPGMTPAWQAVFAVSYAGLAVPMLNGALFHAQDSFFDVNILQPGYDFSPVYYQFTPVRTFWFAVFVWLCGSESRFTRPWFIPLGYVLAGTSFLWNADTGLVILIAWTGMLVYRRMDSWRRDPLGLLRHATTHLVALAATIVGSLAFYAAFAWLRSGQLPRYDELFFFQRVFYESGFYMVTMPLWEFWQPIFALLAFTMAWCMRQVVRERIHAPAPWVFFIAAYGLGTFSYYQGRSLPQVLPAIFLPVFLLAFFWTRQGLSALAGRTFTDIARPTSLRLIAIQTVPVILFCLCGFINLCRSLPAAVLYATNTTSTRDAREMDPLTDAMRSHVAGKAVAIMIDPEAFLHTKAGSWSVLPVASLTEVFLRSQLAQIQRTLETPGTLIVVQPHLLSNTCQQLDLSSFTVKHQLPFGALLMEYDPKAEGASASDADSSPQP